ncbi:MAG: hypothetical protein GC136_04745 [Alphaproteobacteria bacterium]|nr:hypothetical protein [Alphaproteobacteria bacterium]
MPRKGKKVTLQDARARRRNHLLFGVANTACAAAAFAATAFSGLHAVNLALNFDRIVESQMQEAVPTCLSYKFTNPDYTARCVDLTRTNNTLLAGFLPFASLTLGWLGLVFSRSARSRFVEARGNNTTVERLLAEQAP